MHYKNQQEIARANRKHELREETDREGESESERKREREEREREKERERENVPSRVGL